MRSDSSAPLDAAQARASAQKRFPSRGFFETQKASVTRGASSILHFAGASEVAFPADAEQLIALMSVDSLLHVDVASFDPYALPVSDSL